jgi:predicted nucleic acid-binding protein
MNEFFDMSVLVATFWHGHIHHEKSLKRFAAATKPGSACALHTLAEVYAVMTALPLKELLPPEQVLLFVEEIRHRLSIIALNESEYCAALEDAAGRGFTGGRIYDALLLRCAMKVKAENIYTWNAKHFQAIAPEIADRIRTP